MGPIGDGGNGARGHDLRANCDCTTEVAQLPTITAPLGTPLRLGPPAGKTADIGKAEATRAIERTRKRNSFSRLIF
jgi:hypothetical protein